MRFDRQYDQLLCTPEEALALNKLGDGVLVGIGQDPINIAHPKFREKLERGAKKMGLPVGRSECMTTLEGCSFDTVGEFV